ncbi:MAG: sensor histidine kinase, partial [Sciscionella sp.]
MHRRIVVLVVLAAVLATSLFGIPLAIGAARYYQSDEFTELERLADHAAVDAAADLVRGRDPGELPAAQRGTTLGLYDPHGMLISGSGPRGAGTVVGAALRDGSVHSQSVAGSLVVAVPVADTVHVAGVVRASTSQSEA